MVVMVQKADGGVEEYLHTKVLLCISNSLCAAGEYETDTAQRLAEAVTAFIYGMNRDSISSAEILSMVKVVLSETGHDEAMAALDEYHRRRSLSRMRTEVVEGELLGIRDAEMMRAEASGVRQWSKGRVVRQVMETFGLEQQAARAVAGRVEERVLAMAISRVWSGLVRQIVVSETAATLRAEAGLAGASTHRSDALVIEAGKAVI